MDDTISYGHLRCLELAPHRNRGMEITYIEKGMLEWMVEGVVERVAPGSVFFTLPWQVHGSLHPKEPSNDVWHVLFHLEEDYPHPRKGFRFSPRLGFTEMEMKRLSAVFCRATRHCFPASAAMRHLMPALIGELQSSHELRSAHSVSLLRAVLVELKRIVSGEAVEEHPATPSEGAVHGLLGTLSASCGQPWTLTQMGNQCGIHRTRLSLLFQKLTGSTPMEYLQRLRIERAKALLRETGLKVIDIALECGFNSSQHFANTFKQATSMTPSEYRHHAATLTTDEINALKRMGFRSEQEERKRVEAFSTD